MTVLHVCQTLHLSGCILYKQSKLVLLSYSNLLSALHTMSKINIVILSELGFCNFVIDPVGKDGAASSLLRTLSILQWLSVPTIHFIILIYLNIPHLHVCNE